jgi:hypothetical protein
VRKGQLLLSNYLHDILERRSPNQMADEPPFCLDIRTKKEGEDSTIVGRFEFRDPVEIVLPTHGKISFVEQFQITCGLVSENLEQPWKPHKKSYARCIHIAQEVSF